MGKASISLLRTLAMWQRLLQSTLDSFDTVYIGYGPNPSVPIIWLRFRICLLDIELSYPMSEVLNTSDS